MKTPTLLSLGLMMYSLALLHVGAHAAQADAVRAAIEAQSSRFTAALARGDAAEAARHFTVDARLSVPGIDGVLNGRATIEAFWKGVLGNGMKSLTLTTRDLEGRGDLRVETGSYAAFGANRQELGRGEYLMVWKREGDAWKIHRDYGHPGAADGARAAANPRAGQGAGLPRDYATSMRQVGDTLYNEQTGNVTTVFANELAAATKGFSQERYPDGSVVVMEFAQPQRDGEGELLRDARGVPLKGPLDNIAVMRRIAGFGAVYGEQRAGEWEFSTYRPDGSTLIAPDQAVGCAGCHRKAADRDFVYRNRRWTVD